MEPKVTRILYEGGTGEIVEKKSRFIATVQTIADEEEALSFLARIKKKYWDASHNCYACVTGAVQRYSDGGEPSGTAGRPMLDVLLKEEIQHAAVVVTRYFGGTLLGTGGLVRAYQKAVQEGLRNSVIAEQRQGILLNITAGYHEIGKLQHILAKWRISAVDTQYTQDVVTKALVPLEELAGLTDEITEALSGRAEFEKGEAVAFAWIGNDLKIFTNI